MSLHAPGGILPALDGASVAGLVPALLGGRDASWLPAPAREADQVVLCVLDGLGWNEIERHRERMPTLARMEGGPITTVVPATTATALTSIATGLAPAQHGIMGYRMRVGRDVLNVLRWSVQGGGRAPVAFVRKLVGQPATRTNHHARVGNAVHGSVVCRALAVRRGDIGCAVEAVNKQLSIAGLVHAVDQAAGAGAGHAVVAAAVVGNRKGAADQIEFATVGAEHGGALVTRSRRRGRARTDEDLEIEGPRDRRRHAGARRRLDNGYGQAWRRGVKLGTGYRCHYRSWGVRDS
jgi:hypothetical protein